MISIILGMVGSFSDDAYLFSLIFNLLRFVSPYLSLNNVFVSLLLLLYINVNNLEHLKIFKQLHG